MSAPPSELPSSISSSGHTDGLGRRVLAFDRETGGMLERLHVRPELAAFEAAIRDRVEPLAPLSDERFARPHSVERDPDTGDLTVVSGFVAGSRLAEIVELAREQGAVPGVDVALGYLLAALPGLSALHTIGGFPHGLIDPGRTVLTGTGQVVLLDCAFGAVVERLRLSRRRLWTDFGIAAPPGSDVVALDTVADVAQTTLNAVMLVLGRAVRHDEYPDGIASLLMEVVEVAQIRGSSGFAGSLQRILQRSLPLQGRRPYRSADEMVVDVRQLVRREIGVDVCRKALSDFVLQMDATAGVAIALPCDDAPHDYDDVGEVAEEDDDTASTALEFEVPLDSVAGGDEEPDSVYDLTSFDAPKSELPPVVDSRRPEPARAAVERRPLEDVFEIAIPEPSITIDISPHDLPERAWESSETSHSTASETTSYSDPARSWGSGHQERPESGPSSEWSESAPEAVQESFTAPGVPPVAAEARSALPADSIADTAGAESATEEPVHESRSSRRKRHQQKSARARKDKLRSTSTPAKTAAAAAPPAPAPAAKESKSGWLVPPERAARFEPPVEPPPLPPPPPPVARPIAPPMPVYPAPPAAYAPPAPVYTTPQPPSAPPASVVPQPIFPATQSTSGYGVPSMPKPAAAAAPAPVVKAESAPLKLKAEPPSGYVPTARAKRHESAVDRSVESVSALPYVHRGPMFETAESRGFPWKLAAAAVAIIAVAIVVGRAYLPGALAKDAAESTEKAAGATPGPNVATEPPKPAAPPAKGMGQITVETQPAGARVLIDGKAVGDSPLTTDVPPGRHTVTLIGQSGSVKRTVRVAAGKTVSLDVPIFSGWVAVFSPVALEIAENGQSLGTTEQNRIMLSPGRHKLTLSNPDLGYSAEQEVDIEPGEVRSVTVTPRGTASFNAVPWAEVWMDGQRIGETPIANYELPLGLREFTFKHPQLGERKVSTTVRARTPSAVSVDFTRQ